MDKYFEITYEGSDGDEHVDRAETRDEAEVVAAFLADEGMENIKIKDLRV